MTRYIGEPSPEKKLAEGRALTESLARRPAPEVAPAAAGSTSYFRAYFMRFNGSPLTAVIAGIGSGNVQVRYDWWKTSDLTGTIFQPMAFAGAGSSNPPVVGTDVVGSVRLKQSGHYTITMGMELNNTVTDHKQEWNDSDTPFGYPDGGYGGSTQYYQNWGFMVTTITRIYPLPNYGTNPAVGYWPLFLGSGGFVEGYVTVGSRNVTGIDNNELRYAYLEILWTAFTIPPG